MKLSVSTGVCAYLLAFGGMANAQQVSVFEPIGVAADATRVLVSSPYCQSRLPQGTETNRVIYNIISGSAVTYATLPNSITEVNEDCIEVYLAIASGLGGFTPGDVFFTFGNEIRKVTGTTSTLFTTAGASSDHAGIGFDTVGTFGYNMIVTGENGTIFVIDHNANVVQTLQSNVPGGPVSDVKLEAPIVAPLSFGQYGGYLWLMGEASQKMYVLSPLDHSTTVLPPTFTGNSSPESTRFILNNNLCTLTINGTPYSYFDAFYHDGSARDNTVGFFNLNTLMSDGGVSPPIAVVSEEFSGTIDFVSPAGVMVGLPFPLSMPPQQEGSSLVTPRTDTPGCPVDVGCVLTQGGYKNHYNSKVLNFPAGGLTLGTVVYTNAQLNQILQDNAVGGNGLISLAHQLITAQLNIAYGAYAAPSVSAAIGQANALIGSLLIPPIGTGHLSPSSESAIENVLNNFNSGLMGPTECQ